MIPSKTIEGFCEMCNTPLTGRQKKTCSAKCYKERRKRHAREYRLNHIEKIREYSRKHYLKTRMTKTRMTKYCVICKKELTGKQRKYCCDKCSRERKNKEIRKRRRNNRVPKFCVICDKELGNGQRKLCSDKCRKERKNERTREYRLNNPEKIRDYFRKYYQDNPEKIRGYRLNHIEKVKEYGRDYRQNHPEKLREYGREYRLNHIEKAKKYNHEYRLRQAGLPDDFIEASLHQKRKRTNIELIIEYFLLANNIFDYEFQKHIKFYGGGLSHTVPDFFIDPFCIYADGYTHQNSNCYGKNAQDRDIAIDNKLMKMGLIPLRLWHKDIYNGDRPWLVLDMTQPEYKQELLNNPIDQRRKANA